MAKGVYPRTAKHLEIARRGSASSAAIRRGRTFEELFGSERAARMKELIRAAKIGDNNPAKRDEIRRKIAATSRGRPSWLKGLSKETDSRVMAISRARKGIRVGAAVYISKESLARRGARIKAAWASRPDMKARSFSAENNERRRISHLKALHEGKYKNKKDTNIERYIEKTLIERGLVLDRGYFKQVPMPQNSPQYVVDFYIPGENLVVEGYGCFWHKCEACGYDGPRETDIRKHKLLTAHGITLQIIWGHEL